MIPQANSKGKPMSTHMRFLFICLSAALALAGCAYKHIEVPVEQQRTVWKTKVVTKEIDSTCSGVRMVPPGSIDVDKYRRIAVYPFRSEGFSSETVLLWSSAVESWLVDSGQFDVVTRSKLDALYKEQKGESGRLDPRIVGKLRRIHEVQGVVHAAIFKLDPNPRWVVQFIDSETSEVLWSRFGPGDLTADPSIAFKYLLEHEESYTYPCKKTVQDTISYPTEEAYTAYETQKVPDKEKTANIRATVRLLGLLGLGVGLAFLVGV
jgi:hypothetical protein